MTNVSNEREIFEIDVGDPLESEKVFLSRFVGVAVKEIVRWEIKRGYLSPSPARFNNYNSMKQ